MVHLWTLFFGSSFLDEINTTLQFQIKLYNQVAGLLALFYFFRVLCICM